jgi:hypothetical protein
MTTEPKVDIVKALDEQARKRSGWTAAAIAFGAAYAIFIFSFGYWGTCAGMAALNHDRSGVRLDYVLLPLVDRGRCAAGGVARGARLEVPLVIRPTASARARRSSPSKTRSQLM